MRVQSGARVPSNLMLSVGDVISVDSQTLAYMGRL